MKRSWMLVIMCSVAMLLTMTLESHAASARVRCRVRPNRLRIQVDGRNLAPGVYRAVVRNLDTSTTVRTERGKEDEATALDPNVDLDFDNTADANDFDSSVPLDFAAVGDRLRALVIDTESRLIVGRATTECVAQ